MSNALNIEVRCIQLRNAIAQNNARNNTLRTAFSFVLFIVFSIIVGFFYRFSRNNHVAVVALGSWSSGLGRSLSRSADRRSRHLQCFKTLSWLVFGIYCLEIFGVLFVYRWNRMSLLCLGNCWIIDIFYGNYVGRLLIVASIFFNRMITHR